MLGIRHPFGGALYEQDGDGNILVTTADGRRVFVRREPAPALMNAAVDPMTSGVAMRNIAAIFLKCRSILIVLG